MLYKNELSFLCDVFRKSHIAVRIAEQAELVEELRENGSSLFDSGALLRGLGATLTHQTLYIVKDGYECSYRYLLLPSQQGRCVLLIGPYLTSPIFSQRLLEIGEQNGISPENHRYLAEYYSAIPVIPDDSPLFLMLSTLCETVWHTKAYAVKDTSEESVGADAPFTKTMRNLGIADTLLNMKAIEQRYAFENDMMRAVAQGQPQLENRFSTAFSADIFERRAANPLRNLKNYGIIMNTLLRKSAERGGVHPIYLDQISSEFALKIENMSAISENFSLMSEMFRAYSLLVRKHSQNGLSSVVQRAMLVIDADLSADISSSVIAEGLGVTLGYLSSVFKKETGKTVSEYIRTRRMEYAEYLLETTNLQVQTVALHCGIMDVQYFSKLFKRHHGKTPTEYRASKKHLEPDEDV